MKMGKKRGRRKRGRRIMLSMLILLAALLIFSSTVAAPPSPHNVRGKVLTNSSNGVQNGIPVTINTTVTGDFVLTFVSAPPSPSQRGSYSATVSGEDNEFIILRSWNITHWGTSNTTLAHSTTTINIKLNRTRPSEPNVTILAPSDNEFRNKSISFNVTANITILGADGTKCNATISFSNENVLNLSYGGNYTNPFGAIPFGSSRITKWKVQGYSVGKSNITVTARCSSDGMRFDAVPFDTALNINIQNLAPKIANVTMSPIIDLLPGENLTVLCNATVRDFNTVSDISLVNATFFQQSVGHKAADDMNSHYTNTSCTNSSSSRFESNYSCAFSVAYFTNNGTWQCNVTATDGSNASVANDSMSSISQLLAVDISPSIIDYGAILPLGTSLQDVEINITNLGNVNFNISVFGYGRQEGDRIAMNCTKGNVSITNERHSAIKGQSFDAMTNLTELRRTAKNITFPQRTNDLAYEMDRNTTYWKLSLPASISGTCNGTVVFGTVLE